MVRHHQKERERGYKRNIVINAVGAVATLIVLLIVGGTKFTSGAWVPLVVIPMIVLLFKSIKRHYRTVAEGLRVTPEYKPRRMNYDGRYGRRASRRPKRWPMPGHCRRAT